MGEEALQRFHLGEGARVLRRFPQLQNAQVLQLPAGRSVEAALARYRASGLVEAAEPDYLVHAALAPDDPRFLDGTQWALRNTGQSGGVAGADISATAAWDTLHSAEEVIVAVVDSGLRVTHHDLAANLWTNPGEIPGNGRDDDRNGFVDDVHGINAINDSGDVTDEHGHGTHVAGIIGAVGNNGLGVAGVAWRVQLMACKFMDATGNGAVSDAIQCIDYARQKGAKVINASWGGPDSSSFLRSAIDRARQAGIIFVAAAGNESKDNDASPTYPANFPLDNIVVVAATTRTDTLADYSNYGATTVDLAAPGSVIYSTGHSGDDAYVYLSGTSMATPHVTGALALLRARFPGAAYGELIERVLSTTDTLPSLAGKTVTGGRLNLLNALGPAVVAAFSASPPSGSPPLTVSFTDQSQGAITRWLWDFGDGTATSSEQHPTHVFERPGRFTVTLTVWTETGASATATKPISVVANYRIEPAAFEWIDPNGMSEVPLANDGVSEAIPLPFTFELYGEPYERLYVAANGMVGFVNQGLGVAANTDLPNGAAPNAVLYPYWDDLDPSAGGSVRFGVIGSSPPRQAVVSWVDVPRRGRQPVRLTFQAVLEEGSNEVVFQYLAVDASRPQGAGRSATIGVEDAGGAVAAKYSYNGSALLSDQLALRFVPSAVGRLTVTPDAEWQVSGVVGGPFSPASQTFWIRNEGNASLEWSASKSQPWLVLSASGGTLAPAESAEVTVSLTEEADNLRAGAYSDALRFVNLSNGLGNTTRGILLTVEGTTGVLTVTPEAGLESSGKEGGPFSPLSQVYTLINTGDAALEWAASADVGWVTLSSSQGTLAVGQSTTVTVTVNTEAGSLKAGSYGGVVQFTNVTNGAGDTSRPVSLVVNSRVAPSLSLEISPLLSSLSLRLAGDAESSYVLEVSADLAVWTPVATNRTDADGLATFSLPAVEAARQFYRARLAE